VIGHPIEGNAIDRLLMAITMPTGISLESKMIIISCGLKREPIGHRDKKIFAQTKL
jgi:hypothetical protein